MNKVVFSNSKKYTTLIVLLIALCFLFLQKVSIMSGIIIGAGVGYLNYTLLENGVNNLYLLNKKQTKSSLFSSFIVRMFLVLIGLLIAVLLPNYISIIGVGIGVSAFYLLVPFVSLRVGEK